MDTRRAGAGQGARSRGASALAAAAAALSLPTSFALGTGQATAQGVESATDATTERVAPEIYVPPGNSRRKARKNAPPVTGLTATGAEWKATGELAVVEGDMIIGRVSSDGRLLPSISRRGLGHSRLIGRWPDGIVPYEFVDGINETQRSTVLAAIDHWNANTRLLFVARTPENADAYPERLQFFPTGNCASYVGRVDDQPQPVYVQGCTLGSVIHELGHAIGLYHEHTRPDRDSWIRVDNSQILEGLERNFKIQTTNARNYGPYDYDSIMHYGPSFFAKGDRPTIIAPNNVSIGQRQTLSDGDVRAANALYATDLALTAVTRDAGGTFEIDVTVDNLGQLGASALELVVTIGPETRWVGMSEGSGWDCTKDGAELYCRRATLPETAPQARLKLQAEPGPGAVPADVRARVASRTLDTNMDNNVVGGSAPALAAANEEAAEDGHSFQRAEAPAAAAPAPAPAPEPAPENPFATSEAAPSTTVASSGGGGDGGGGGAGGFASLVALAVALGIAHARRAVRLRRLAARVARAAAGPEAGGR